jgi:hypothetical protein
MPKKFTVVDNETNEVLDEIAQPSTKMKTAFRKFQQQLVKPEVIAVTGFAIIATFIVLNNKKIDGITEEMAAEDEAITTY